MVVISIPLFTEESTVVYEERFLALTSCCGDAPVRQFAAAEVSDASS